MPTQNPTDPAQEAPLIAGFEAAFKELEAIVEQLESGDLSLDETLAAYERGMQRLRECQRALDAADARLAELQNNPDALSELASDASGSGFERGEVEDGRRSGDAGAWGSRPADRLPPGGATTPSDDVPF